MITEHIGVNLFLKMTQSISVKLIGNKNNYLNTPHEIISMYKINNISMFGHLLTSISGTILLVLKLFPVISTDFAKQLENNGTIIPLTVLIFFIPITIINGIIVEKVLIKTNSRYKDYVEKEYVE